ncbi:hypothetical protein C8R45DRAFT_1167557 [Mycena sanguinolenta]|nr:hypothetical protein C8R45DRAFT_1167557 [Mycena sanguinolenta]
MANLPTATATPASRSDSELEALVALVSRLAKLPLALAKHSASSTTWIRSIAKTPHTVDTAFPDGSGEVWYAVIRGRKPGLYHTAAEANAQTDGVPHQFREKKSRREALAFYRDHYNAGITYDNLVGAATASGSAPPPVVNMGVQKPSLSNYLSCSLRVNNDRFLCSFFVLFIRIMFKCKEHNLKP